DVANFVRQAIYYSSTSSRFTEHRDQSALLAHILGGNHPSAVPKDGFPITVGQLAEALYSGDDCAFALHDALLETGHTELAEHFAESEHPKGCWALDLILGKQ